MNNNRLVQQVPNPVKKMEGRIFQISNVPQNKNYLSRKIKPLFMAEFHLAAKTAHTQKFSQGFKILLFIRLTF